MTVVRLEYFLRRCIRPTLERRPRKAYVVKKVLEILKLTGEEKQRMIDEGLKPEYFDTIPKPIFGPWF